MKDSKPETLGGLTPRRVPEAFMRAEIASYPLVGLSGFKQALTVLEPSLEGSENEGSEDGRKTGQLWRSCEVQMSQHAGGWSLDRLVAIRDFFWFENQSINGFSRRRKSTTLYNFLEQLAKKHLERHSGFTGLAQREGTSLNAAIHYRWLTFALPEDLLLAALGIEPPPTRVSIEPPLLIKCLEDKGAAEIHQHIGAGMNFQYLWDSLLAALASSSLDYSAFSSPGLALGDGDTYLKFLLAGAIARCLLAEFLMRSVRAPHEPIWAFLKNLCFHPRWWPQRRRTFEKALVALSEGQEEDLPKVEDLHLLYQDLHPQGYLMSLQPIQELSKEKLSYAFKNFDPVTVRLPINAQAPGEGEQWLIRNALNRYKQIERENEESQKPFQDSFFDRLFWQVVRLRCIFFREIVQRPMTAGLQWFIRHYGRGEGIKRPLEPFKAQVSYLVAGSEHVAALEARIGFRDSPYELAENLASLLKSWQRVLKETGTVAGGRTPEFGVLLHFIKVRDPLRSWKAGKPPAFGAKTHAEPRLLNFENRRYSDFFFEQSKKMNALAELIQAVPQIMWLVRGVDVCNDELGIPPWVLAPLLQYLECHSARIAADRSYLKLPPLRTTIHVGEDYRHLMEGIRHVFECVVYLLKQPGGRLGHATALGIDPRFYAESVGTVLMPQEERLWDLIFEWRLYSHFRVPDDLFIEVPPERLIRIEDQIRQLSAAIYDGDDKNFEPAELAEVHHVLHSLWYRPVSFQEDNVEPSLDFYLRTLKRLNPAEIRYFERVRTILEQYLESQVVFQRGQQLVDITLDGSEISALYAAQDALRRCIGCREIVVEVNPSSNLLIGNLLDLRNHPILRLFPPECEPGAPPPVHVAIGSDDPIVFSTNLLKEYSFLHDAALNAGYSESSVLEWLKKIQETSMHSRFTEPWKPTALKMTRKLLRLLKRYCQNP